MTSSVPAVKAALVTLLTVTLPTAQVRYGPRGPTTRDDVVSVGGIPEAQDNPATLGTARKQDEVYQVEVIVSCSRSGPDTQQTSTEAALALYGAAKDALRTSPNEALGVAGVFWARPTGRWSLAESEGADLLREATNATLRFVVEVKARV